jgi:hypothetical protein|tara:strand:- start:90 stop:338 length:249 start_codon:yes stop_codon:yes gene_type:complete
MLKIKIPKQQFETLQAEIASSLMENELGEGLSFYIDNDLYDGTFNPLPPLNKDGQAIYKTWSDESELILTSNGLEKDNGNSI